MQENLKGLYRPAEKYYIKEEYNDSRLDNCLISILQNLPRSKIYSIIRKGEVRVNGSRCKPSFRLKKGDIVRIPPHFIKIKAPSVPNKSLIAILKSNIIFKNESVVVINKPVGLASHGGSGLSLGLIEAVRQMEAKFKDAQLVHRLDRETSGCIVLTLKRSVLRKLNEELRNGTVEKKYLAVVKGKWPIKLNKVNLNLKKNILRSGEREVQINSKGKEAKTNFRLIKTSSNLSLIECELLTGRTHQIRVHTSNLGYPIIGDKKYGDKDLNKKFRLKGVDRMLLHAKSVRFLKYNLFCTSKEPGIFQELFYKHEK